MSKEQDALIEQTIIDKLNNYQHGTQPKELFTVLEDSFAHELILPVFWRLVAEKKLILSGSSVQTSTH